VCRDGDAINADFFYIRMTWTNHIEIEMLMFVHVIQFNIYIYGVEWSGGRG
jgi:hypothetical protein